MAKPVPVRRVLGYARVSSVEQALGTSLRDQRDAITAYAKGRGLEVSKFYVEAESGIREKQERRTQMLALQRDVREGDLVLCSKLDRWSRDTKHTLVSVEEIIYEKKAAFYAIDDACDPSTRDGHMMMTMRAMMAREEHARIRERMVGTRQILRNAGLYADGLVPVGYVRSLPKGERGPEKNVLKIEPEGAALVRKAFAMCIAGKSLAKISAAIGIESSLVAKMLKSRTYMGQIENTSGEWIRARHEPIVDAATYARARAALDSRRLGGAKPRGAPSETSSWILRDVAMCTCGARMSAAYAGPHGEGRRYYYRCTKRCGLPFVPVRAIEALAAEAVLARFGEICDELARPAKAVPAPKAVNTTEKRTKLATRRDRFLEQHADGLIDTATLRGKLASIDAEVMKLDAEDGAAAPRPSTLADKGARRELLRSVEQIAKRWARAPAERRRQMVNVLATSFALEVGADPRPTWKTHEDLAADVA